MNVVARKWLYRTVLTIGSLAGPAVVHADVITQNK